MFNQTAIFLVRTLFELYIMVLVLRVFLTYHRANFYNPVSQLVIKLTNPVLMPMKSFMPGFRGVDLGAVLLIYILDVIKMTLIVKLSVGFWPPVSTILVIGIFASLSDVIMFLFYMVILRVILGCVGTAKMGALQEISYLITEPLLAPVRAFIPPLSGFDLSPLVISIALIATDTLLGSSISAMI